MSDLPAVLFRQAAEKLRETAKHATPGPWMVHEAQGGFLRVEGSGDYSGYCEGADLHLSNRGTANWIALAHPALAGPLADWLEWAAKAHDATVQAAHDNWRGSDDTEARDRWIDRQTDQHALKVARTILGKETR